MKILGIEFGSWSLKAVEMESRFRRLDILDFHEVRLPLELMNPTEIYQKAVKQLLARLPSHPDKIVTSLPPTQSALRFLPTPLRQRKKVEQMYRFELEDSVPFRLDDAIIEHHVMITSEGSVVFAAIAPEKHVRSYVEWLQSIGVDPDWLTFEGMGLVNLYLSSYDPKNPPLPGDSPQEGPVLLLDMGHHKTNLAIFQQNRLQLFRTIAWGGADITRSIALTFNASSEEAERFKMNDLKLNQDPKALPPDQRELVSSTSQAFSPFIADVNHSLVAYRTTYKERVSLAMVTGGSSKIWGIEQFLTGILGIPVQKFQPLATMPMKSELQSVDEARFGEVTGRAIVFGRKVPILFNFRRQAAAKGTSLEEISKFITSPNVRKLLQYSGILLLILFLHIQVAGYLSVREHDQRNKELLNVFQMTFPDVAPQLRNTLTKSPVDLKKFIDKKSNELKQKLKLISKDRTPMITLIQEISRAFPSEIKVDVNNVTLDDRTFLIEGVLYEGDLAQVTKNLQGLAHFKEVTLSVEGQRFAYRGSVTGR